MQSAGGIVDRGSWMASPGEQRVCDGGSCLQAGPVIVWRVV